MQKTFQNSIFFWNIFFPCLWWGYIVFILSNAGPFHSLFGWTLGILLWAGIFGMFGIVGKMIWIGIGAYALAFFGTLPIFLVYSAMGCAVLLAEFVYAHIFRHHGPFVDTATLALFIFSFLGILLLGSLMGYFPVSYYFILISVRDALIMIVLVYGALTALSNYSKYGALLPS